MSQIIILILALCNLIWDKLEGERKDCTFVYLTHNVNFAVSRINAEIIIQQEGDI